MKYLVAALSVVWMMAGAVPAHAGQVSMFASNAAVTGTTAVKQDHIRGGSSVTGDIHTDIIYNVNAGNTPGVTGEVGFFHMPYPPTFPDGGTYTLTYNVESMAPATSSICIRTTCQAQVDSATWDGDNVSGITDMVYTQAFDGGAEQRRFVTGPSSAATIRRVDNQTPCTQAVCAHTIVRCAVWQNDFIAACASPTIYEWRLQSIDMNF